MPKSTRRRSGGHEKSVPIRVAERKFAAGDAHEHVALGSEVEISGSQILASMTADEEAEKPMKKKEKQALKHELFVQRLESSRSPYSKSHERRLKRKAKEQVAGGLDDIQAAISFIAGDPPAGTEGTTGTAVVDSRPKPGQIGEGKSAPLSKSQRKRALRTERLRVPMILSNPDFAANPFKTIRTHAQNTLVERKIPDVQ